MQLLHDLDKQNAADSSINGALLRLCQTPCKGHKHHNILVQIKLAQTNSNVFLDIAISPETSCHYLYMILPVCNIKKLY